MVANVEVTEIASDTKLSAKTSDLSDGGCFLDMLNPSPEGTEIRVKILHANKTFTALGRVVFLFPNMGMGVMFTSVDANQQAVLQKWLEDVGGNAGEREEPIQEGREIHEQPVAGHARVFLLS